jgi:hypothetical protein
MPPSRPPEDDTLVEVLHELRDLMQAQNEFMAAQATTNPRLRAAMEGKRISTPPDRPNPASGPVVPGMPWQYTQVGPTPGVTYYGNPAGSNQPPSPHQPMMPIQVPGQVPIIMSPEEAAKRASRPPPRTQPSGYRFQSTDPSGQTRMGIPEQIGEEEPTFRARPLWDRPTFDESMSVRAARLNRQAREGAETRRWEFDPNESAQYTTRDQIPDPRSQTRDLRDVDIEDNKSTPQKAYDRTIGALLNSGQGAHGRLMQANPLYGSLATAGAAAALGTTNNPVLQSAAGNILSAGSGGGGGGGLLGGGLGGGLLRFAIAHKLAAAVTTAGLAGGGTVFGANSIQAQGADLGFERGQQWNVPGTNIGFQTPFARNDPLQRIPFFPDIPRPSPAVWEEVKRRWTTFRLGSEAGISMNQAAEITGGLRGLGYSQSNAQDAAFNSIAPLVRRGLSPNIANSMFDQSVRMGNASLEDFNTSMANLNEVAQATRQTMDEAAEGISQFAESAQNMGAYRNQGVASGMALAGASGLSGAQLTRWTENPLVQAMGFQRQGIMPLAFGAARPGMQAQAIEDSFNMMKAATQPYARETRGPGGERISAQQNQYAAMSRMMGVPVDEIARMDRIRTRLPSLARANEALGRFGEAGARAHRASRRVTAEDETFDDRGVPIRTHEEAQELADKINRGRSGRERRALEGKPWEDVRKALEDAAPESGKARENYLKRVADISKLRDPSSRFKEAQELLRDQSRTKVPEEPTVKLDLTSWAKRLVRDFDREHNTGKSNARKGKGQVNKDKMEPDQRQQTGGSGDSIGMG